MPRRPSFRRDENGVVAIEFAVLAVPFFLILFAIMELALILLASTQFEDAADRVSRGVMVGQIARTEDAIRTRLCQAIVLPVNCASLKVGYREFASVDSFALAPAVQSGAYNPAAFKFEPVANPSFASLRVGYEWPIAIKPMAQFFGKLKNKKTFLLGSAIMRIEKS